MEQTVSDPQQTTVPVRGTSFRLNSAHLFGCRRRVGLFLMFFPPGAFFGAVLISEAAGE
jgi:hypothetical protein